MCHSLREHASQASVSLYTLVLVRRPALQTTHIQTRTTGICTLTHFSSCLNYLLTHSHRLLLIPKSSISSQCRYNRKGKSKPVHDCVPCCISNSLTLIQSKDLTSPTQALPSSPASRFLRRRKSWLNKGPRAGLPSNVNFRSQSRSTAALCSPLIILAAYRGQSRNQLEVWR